MGNTLSSIGKMSSAVRIKAQEVTCIILYYFFSAKQIISNACVRIVGGLTALGSYIYVKLKGRFGHQQMFETQNATQLSVQELQATQVSETIPKLPQWKKIPLSDQDLQQIQDLKKLQYDKKVQLYSCPLSKQVMRQPVATSCCNKQYEKVMFLDAIQKVGICPNQNCKKLSNEIKIQQSIMLEDAIHTFRLKVRKTYRGLPDCEQKKKWKQMIEEDFGKNYVKSYL